MSSTMLSSQTDEDFHKAHNKAMFNELQHFLNPDEAMLISFSDIKKMLKPKNEVYKGMMVVPIQKIVGSEGRYHDFDNRFFPRSLHLKTRWEHIDMAHIQDINLPPISLYELGGLYFGDNLAKMTKQVINYEKRVFYTETNFGDITDYWLLDFSTTGQYDVIYNHILTHKYYINMNKSDEISLEEAIISWFNTVYMPVIAVIDKHHVMRYFKRRTKADMYVWLIKYWDELKQKFNSEIPLDTVADYITNTYGLSFRRKVWNKIAQILLKKHIENNSEP